MADVPDRSSGTGREPLMSRQAVKAFTTFSDATLWREIARGHFPAPVSISKNRKVFLRSEVEAWMQRRIAAARRPEHVGRGSKRTEQA
jgi:predicted DNA-binding transcriptional regulator AlpA